MLSMLSETLFGVFALFILTKVLGKTQISQLTAFDFIAAIILGELIGNALFDEKAGIKEIAFVIILWGAILYTIEMITQKFKESRFILEGKPAFIIHNGKLIYEEMRKNKIDLNEVQHLLRNKNVFSIQEVAYAILETNGELSVLKKDMYQHPTKKDLNLVPTTDEIAMTIITDGEFIKDNLAEANVTEEWVRNELKRQGFDSVQDIFYAEYIENSLFLLPYTKIRKKDMKKKKS